MISQLTCICHLCGRLYDGSDPFHYRQLKKMEMVEADNIHLFECVDCWVKLEGLRLDSAA